MGRAVLAAAHLALAVMIASGRVGAAEVYQSTGEHGEPAFSQQPHPGAKPLVEVRTVPGAQLAPPTPPPALAEGEGSGGGPGARSGLPHRASASGRGGPLSVLTRPH